MTTFTPAYKAHLSGRWRALAEESLRGAEDTVKRDGPDLLNWAAPCDQVEDRLALFALARLAVASARSRTAAAKAKRQPALKALAMLALDLLGEPPAPVQRPPASLPFRKDIDG